MAVPASAMRAARAWLLDVAGGIRLAAGAPFVVEYLLEPQTIELPRTPAHCRRIMLWRGRIIPLIDLAPVIFGVPGATGDWSRTVVLAWQNAPGQPLQYGGLSVLRAPVEILVSDSDAQPLPERPEFLRELAASCFGHGDEVIAILDVRRMFTRPLLSAVEVSPEPELLGAGTPMAETVHAESMVKDIFVAEALSDAATAVPAHVSAVEIDDEMVPMPAGQPVTALNSIDEQSVIDEAEDRILSTEASIDRELDEADLQGDYCLLEPVDEFLSDRFEPAEVPVVSEASIDLVLDDTDIQGDTCLLEPAADNSIEQPEASVAASIAAEPQVVFDHPVPMSAKERVEQERITMREALARHIARASGEDLTARRRKARHLRLVRNVLVLLLVAGGGAALMWLIQSPGTHVKTETPRAVAPVAGANVARTAANDLVPKEVGNTSVPTAPARPPR